MLTDREQDDSYRRAGGLGMEGSSKKEKGLMDMDKSVVISGGRGLRGLNGNGKNIIKIK